MSRPLSRADWHYSQRFVAADTRHAIGSLLRFADELDRLASPGSDPSLRSRQLDWWRTELAQLAEGSPTHPVVQALVPVVQQHRLPCELFAEMLDGVQMEAQIPRLPDFKTFQLYCYRVSGSLSSLIAEVCTCTERATLKYAVELGIAIRQSEIIENLGRDVRLGKILLPMEELQQFEVTAREILACEESPNFLRMIEFNLTRAQTRLRTALDLLPKQDHRAQRFGRILAGIHLATLEEIRRDGGHVLSRQTSPTPIRKWWIAARTSWLT